jgi:inosine-uridine nucleoside N-ribohydrolase
MLALRSPEIALEVVTTVAGNGPVDMTTRNALRVLHYMGATGIPVFSGAECPLEAPFHGALGYHGPDALGNVSIEDGGRCAAGIAAYEALHRFALVAPGQRTLIATGPLTNVALAFRAYPDLAGLLRHVVIMGGAFRLTRWGAGNETPYAEFNIWQDPEAAAVVFASSARISVVGLDVSGDPSTALTAGDVASLRKADSRVAALAADLVDFTLRRHDCCQLHDPLALAIALRPSLFEFDTGRVAVHADDSVYRGMTELTADPNGNVRVARSVDAASFKRMLLERLSQSQ